MNLPVTSGAVASIASAPNCKRRIIQNIGAGDVYLVHDPALTEAQVIAQGIRLKGGADATIGFDEAENNCGYAMYFATPSSSEIRYLDVK